MVLVTGGTGLVGSNLLVQLVINNIEVKAIYRSSQRVELVKKVFSYYSKDVESLFKKINWIKADILDVPSLDIAFKDISHVYHCAAYISFDPSDFDLLEKVNVEGTANIVNLCIEQKIEKLCYVSTIGAVGKSEGRKIVDEESDWSMLNANPYAITKYLAEMEVWRGAQEGVPTVIINPGVILGPGFWNSGSGSFFMTAAKEYNYAPPGGSGFVSVNDVVKVMVNLMNSDIVRERFIIVSENLTYEQILKKIAISLDKKPPKKILSFPMLNILCFLDWIRSVVTNKGRTITRANIYGLKNPVIYDSKKLKKAINFEFTTIDKTISFCSKLFIKEVF